MAATADVAVVPWNVGEVLSTVTFDGDVNPLDPAGTLPLDAGSLYPLVINTAGLVNFNEVASHAMAS